MGSGAVEVIHPRIHHVLIRRLLVMTPTALLTRNPAATVETAIKEIAAQGGITETAALELIETFRLRVGRSTEDLSRLINVRAIGYANLTGISGPI